MTYPKRIFRRRRHAALLLVLGTMTLGSCLGAPEIDERWTKIEFLSVDPAPGQTVTGGQSAPVTVKGRITYRRILTGFLVAEARWASGIPPLTTLDPDEHTEANAAYIDYILANSVTAGRDTRAVTGFDHLMQDINLSFNAQVPPDSSTGGFYLLLYMGDGDEIQLQNGQDSLVVTPFGSSQFEVLHTGFPVGIVP